MFKNKKDDSPQAEGASTGESGADNLSAPPMKPFSRKGSHAPVKPPTSPTFHPEIPRHSPPEIPGIAARGPDPQHGRRQRHQTAFRRPRHLPQRRNHVL
jgi:hypothetical protein